MSQPSSDTQRQPAIVILDFGSQYSELIARRVRETEVFSVVLGYSTSAEELRRMAPKGIILSGGPSSVYAEHAPLCDPGIWDLGIPVLGVCYGMQLMVQQLGGVVEAATGKAEYGKAPLEVDDPTDLLTNVDNGSTMWMSHGDSVKALPEGFVRLAHTANTPEAAVAHLQRKLYGVQFHPEVMHTEHGQHVIERFLREGCGTPGDWTMASIIDTSVEQIRQQVGDKPVICALSGGVDSAVAAALVHKAIGDQLTCVHVDTGLMRLNEADQVIETFEKNFGVRLIFVDASERFFSALAGVTEPEAKRKAIGELFIRVFEDAKAEAAGGSDGRRAEFLVQGTLYPDVIESGSEHASTIKSHHNVGGLPEDMEFELVEPLRSLFKDEVRQVGSELGLPDDIVQRQPFPGPGLGVRIIGEVTPDKVETLQHADFIVREELAKAGLEREIWQSFAVLPDIRSVGVMGDERTYGYPVIIRAVTSEDAMTADWARIPYDVLEAMSSRIINEVPGVNRVAYDITSKPPGTIEWE